jgi:hypothetical protein
MLYAMDYTPIHTHLRARWIPESAIDPAVTPELLQMAEDAGIVEIRVDDRRKLWARIAPHHASKTTVGAWVTPQEAAAIRAHAQAAGLSVSETIRTALQACGLIP